MSLLWWRPSNETWVRRRCPLFSEAYGVGIHSLIVDILHCLHLGVLQKYVVFCWWELIEHNVWNVDASNEDELLSLSLHLLRSALFAWYPRYRAAYPLEASTLTEVPDITPKTLGPKHKFLLKTKAAMTRPLVPFTVDLLKKHPGKIPNQRALQTVGESLDELLSLMRSTSRVPPVHVVQDAKNKKKCKMDM